MLGRAGGESVIPYFAQGLGVSKKALIAHIRQKDIWNLGGGDEEPPSVSTLYKGPRKKYFASDIRHIEAAVQDYADKTSRQAMFEALNEKFRQPDASMQAIEDVFERSPLKRKGDVRHTGFVYVIKSPSLAEDSGNPKVKYGYGYFVMRREFVIPGKAPLASVEDAKAWFLTDQNDLFDGDDKRGTWEAQYVGLSLDHVLIVYDFHFDARVQSAEGYKGLIAAKVNETRKNVFGAAPRAVATGEFYFLSYPGSAPSDATQSKRRSGQFYIERIQDLKDPRDGDEALQTALRNGRAKIDKIFS